MQRCLCLRSPLQSFTRDSERSVDSRERHPSITLTIYKIPNGPTAGPTGSISNPQHRIPDRVSPSLCQTSFYRVANSKTTLIDQVQQLVIARSGRSTCRWTRCSSVKTTSIGQNQQLETRVARDALLVAENRFPLDGRHCWHYLHRA
jgi:hypothetical protein